MIFFLVKKYDQWASGTLALEDGISEECYRVSAGRRSGKLLIPHPPDRCDEYTATHTSIASERNPEAGQDTPKPWEVTEEIHQKEENLRYIPTAKPTPGTGPSG